MGTLPAARFGSRNGSNGSITLVAEGGPSFGCGGSFHDAKVDGLPSSRNKLQNGALSSRAVRGPGTWNSRSRTGFPTGRLRFKSAGLNDGSGSAPGSAPVPDAWREAGRPFRRSSGGFGGISSWRHPSGGSMGDSGGPQDREPRSVFTGGHLEAATGRRREFELKKLSATLPKAIGPGTNCRPDGSLGARNEQRRFGAVDADQSGTGFTPLTDAFPAASASPGFAAKHPPARRPWGNSHSPSRGAPHAAGFRLDGISLQGGGDLNWVGRVEILRGPGDGQSVYPDRESAPGVGLRGGERGNSRICLRCEGTLARRSSGSPGVLF